MADETTTPTQPSDYQKQLEAIEKRAKTLEEQLQRTLTAYEADRQAWQTLFETMKQQPQAPPPPPPGEDEPVEGLTKGQLAKLMEEAATRAAEGRITPVTQTYWATQRATLRQLARVNPNLPKFSRYEKEIEALIDKQPPQLQADPGIYEAAYRAVLASHIEEEIEEQVQSRLKAPKETEEPEETEEAPSPSPPSLSLSPPPAPPGGSPAVSPMRTTPKGKVKLSPEQAEIAQIFGLTPDEYLTHLNTREAPDIFGFVDRKTGIRRTEV